MNPEKLLVASLKDIERLAACACRRSAMREADIEDFTSSVMLKLIENDYAILRKFEGRSRLTTYLTVVIQRLLMDYRNHLLGKWRPSAEARRLGSLAVLLETLIHRDRLSSDEAAALIVAQHPGVSRAEIDALAERLPRRLPRRSHVTLEELTCDPALPAETVERRADATRTRALTSVTGDVVRRIIDSMDEDDRLLFRLRFQAGLSVSDIARMLRTDAAPLYRRLYRRLGVMRTQLESAGVSAGEVEQILGGAGTLEFGFEPSADQAPLHVQRSRAGA